MTKKTFKTINEWQQQLTPEQFSICRLSKTEPPFNNKYWNCHERGTYHCVCCDAPLFSSENKFDSGTGWPSFYAAISSAISEKQDNSYDMLRTEVLCRRCDAHLGHVFADGPKPTGLRYCINSASLNLKHT